MALDGKAIIKEEITDKDAYDAAAAAAVAAGAALAVATAAAVQVPPTSSSAAGSASAAAAAATNSNTNTTSAAATAAAISRRLKGEWSILRGTCTARKRGRIWKIFIANNATNEIVFIEKYITCLLYKSNQITHKMPEFSIPI